MGPSRWRTDSSLKRLCILEVVFYHDICEMESFWIFIFIYYSADQHKNWIHLTHSTQSTPSPSHNAILRFSHNKITVKKF